MVVTLESTSATQARMVRPATSHPCCLRRSSGPDPAPSSQCPRCCAAALSSSRPTVWWMGSTGSRACPPTSRGFGARPQPDLLALSVPALCCMLGSHLLAVRKAQCNGDWRLPQRGGSQLRLEGQSKHGILRGSAPGTPLHAKTNSGAGGPQ